MAISQPKPSTFTSIFNPSNPSTFLQNVFDFIAKESDFFQKDSAENRFFSSVLEAVKVKEANTVASEQNPTAENVPPPESQSKKAAKKEAAKLEKLRHKQQLAAASAAASNLSVEEDDPLAVNYGEIPLNELQSKTVVNVNDWTRVEALNNSLENKLVKIRGWAQTIRPASKKMAFLIIRSSDSFTVQCLVRAQPDLVSPQMVKFAAALTRESNVEVEGVVSIPADPIKGSTQQVEIQVRKLYCVNKAVAPLPINIEDAARSEVEIEKAAQAGEKLVRVNQDTRLKFRVLDLRTPANHAIFRIQSEVGNVFRQFLLAERFIEIHTPKLIAGSSEGGADVFKLDYKGQPACLAQSPQLHKQMAISSGFERVFEIGPVFRAEDSFTHRHLCEFTGLDVEMQIMTHYFEIMDVVDKLFVAIFDSLNANCKKELEAVKKQYPFEPLKYLRNTPRLTYEEGIQMLKEDGIEIEDFSDLNTEAERKLGELVLKKYGTEFYILHRYPSAVRPFYTMSCSDNPAYSASFDVFIRGEEIISGGQRIHEHEYLKERLKARGIEQNTLSSYIDSFSYGTTPHGGFGAGLERVVMLFCGLDNIRKTSLFPRDPKRIAP